MYYKHNVFICNMTVGQLFVAFLCITMLLCNIDVSHFFVTADLLVRI